jgi:VanZ family protein
MSSTENPTSPATPRWTFLLAVYWLGLVILTHMPIHRVEPHFGNADKLVHFVLYAGLSWLLAMAWETSTGRLNGRHLRFAWLAIVLFGVVDEVTQPLFGRDLSFWDWVADGVGAAVGLVLFTWTRRLFSPRSR